MKKILTLMILICVFSGCADKPTSPFTRTAEGILKHFPVGVKSRQAWYGHNFMVGETPVIPTDTVPKKVLLPLVGKKVIAKGIWYEGEKWAPSGEEKFTSMPIEASEGAVIRGDGIKLLSIAVK